jgi:hypothetical protein
VAGGERIMNNHPIESDCWLQNAIHACGAPLYKWVALPRLASSTQARSPEGLR